MANLEEKVRSGRFVITSEIVPPLSATPAKLLAEAELLKGKADAINVTDAAAGKTTMSSFASAALLAANGYEPILQVTCRDRNRIALAGDLIGAAAQGIRNLLILKGDDPKGGDQPDAKPVFDLESGQLLALARDLRDKGELPSGQLWDAYRTVLTINGAMQRQIVLPPGVSPAALAALRTAVLKLNEDKEHAEEAARTIGFVPEWIAGPDTNKEVRSAISISPDMRAFIADYIRQAAK